MSPGEVWGSSSSPGSRPSWIASTSEAVRMVIRDWISWYWVGRNRADYDGI